MNGAGIANFIMGLLIVAAGVNLIIFRVRVSGIFARRQRDFYGKPGELLSRRSTPSTLAFVGVVAVGIGIVAIVTAFTVR